jgi:CRP/FNR family transcriptional regulator
MDAAVHGIRRLPTERSSVGARLVAALSASGETAPERVRVLREEPLFHAGDEFRALYSVHSGSFKVRAVDSRGLEQIVDFPMRGDLFGLDGIGSGRHPCTATALENSYVTVLPYAALEKSARTSAAWQRQLLAALSLEIARKNGMLMLLGSLSAEHRLGSFLASLSVRFRHQGYSPADFLLRMTRKEIGSYLGLKLETVSRCFTRYEQRGVLEVDGKRVRILDYQALQPEMAVV